MIRRRLWQSMFVQVLALGLLGSSANLSLAEDNLAASETISSAENSEEQETVESPESAPEAAEEEQNAAGATDAQEENGSDVENAEVPAAPPSASETNVTELLQSGALSTEPNDPVIPLRAPPTPRKTARDSEGSVQLSGWAQAILNAGVMVLVLVAASVYTASLRQRLSLQNEFIQKRGEALAAVEMRLRETFAARQVELEVQLETQRTELVELQRALDLETEGRVAAETALRFATPQSELGMKEPGSYAENSASLACFLELEGACPSPRGTHANSPTPTGTDEFDRRLRYSS